METCVRGFSYMPEETKTEVLDLQYIESEELERTWKTTRRQRLKEQEQKVWEEFVREQDVVQKLYNDDPYQFLHQLPEDCIKDLLDLEFEKMKKKSEITPESDSTEQPQQGEGDSQPADSTPFSNTMQDEDEKDEGPMFHIYNDNDNCSVASSPSAAESPPATVREVEDGAEPDATDVPLDKKSSENVANVIENSIYCARIKDLRLRILDEIVNSINTLERLEVMSLEREAAARARRRANEFSSRYHTQKLYPLQRQLADIERINKNPAPFGKHTQFQSLMVRVVSLHQNVLLAYQVLCRNFELTFWLEECAGAVRALGAHTRRAAALLHTDQELLTYCMKLDDAMDEYTYRVTTFFSIDSTDASYKKKQKRKMRPLKPAKGNEADKRLSMYSIDTLRLNSKPSTSRHSARTSKLREPIYAQKNIEKADSKSVRKSPRSRRPLMRAPGGAPRARPALDGEVPTLVEDTCLSSHMSRAGSPHSARAPHSARPPAHTPPTAKSQNVTPRQKPRNASPAKHKQRRSHTTKLAKSTTNTKPNQRSKSPRKPTEPDNVEKNINTDDNTTDVATETAVNDKCHTIDISDERKLSKFKSNMKGVEKATKEDEEIDFVSDENMNFDGQDVKDDAKGDREKNKSTKVAARCEVTRLLKQLCSGADQSGAKTERVTGAKNAQLHCIRGSSPRTPSTPQLLRILEETIQKKVPKSMQKKTVRDPEKLRLMFNIPERTANNLFQYRTKFVQHMLASAMYANSAVGRPWEIISSISEQLIDEVLAGFSKELQIKEIIDELYQCETK